MGEPEVNLSQSSLVVCHHMDTITKSETHCQPLCHPHPCLPGSHWYHME